MAAVPGRSTGSLAVNGHKVIANPKRWLKIIGYSAVLFVVALVLFEQQLRYLAFRYLDGSTVTVADSSIQFSPMWVPLSKGQLSSVTLVKIAPMGAETRGMLTLSSGAPVEMGQLDGSTDVMFSWGRGKMGRAQSAIVVAVPSQRLLIISDKESNLNEILSVSRK